MPRTDLARLGIPVAVTVGAIALIQLWLYLGRRRKSLLDKVRKTLKVLSVHEITHDTKRIRLSLGGKNTTLGLPVGKHLCIYAPNPVGCIQSGKWNGEDDPDKGKKEIDRKYTPITGDETKGYVDLVIKIYRPGIVTMPDGKEKTWTDGGKMGLYLDALKSGDSVDINGPFGVVEYLGKGTFKWPGHTVTVSHVGLMAGGTGITPMLQVVEAALRDQSDPTRWSLIYANKTQDDILVRDLLGDAERRSGGRFKVHYTLDFPPAGWEHKKGFITEDMIKECLPAVSQKPLMLMCGPPPMVEHACRRNLIALGHPKDRLINF